MSSILRRLAQLPTRKTPSAPSISGFTTPPEASTAGQSGPIDPNGTTIASILEKLDNESNGLRTDMEEMSRQLGTACDVSQKLVVPLSDIWKQTVKVKRDDKVRKLVR
jgi:hypothetical protein